MSFLSRSMMLCIGCATSFLVHTMEQQPLAFATKQVIPSSSLLWQVGAGVGAASSVVLVAKLVKERKKDNPHMTKKNQALFLISVLGVGGWCLHQLFYDCPEK